MEVDYKIAALWKKKNFGGVISQWIYTSSDYKFTKRGLHNRSLAYFKEW